MNEVLKSLIRGEVEDFLSWDISFRYLVNRAPKLLHVKDDTEIKIQDSTKTESISKSIVWVVAMRLAHVPENERASVLKDIVENLYLKSLLIVSDYEKRFDEIMK